MALLKKSGVCVIGAGNMGLALIKGMWKNARPAHLWVMESNQALAARLRQEPTLAGIDFNPPPQSVEVLLLAVKPQDLPQVVQQHQDLVKRQKTLIISVAAGVRLQTLAGQLPENQPIIRAMPNLGALVGQAVTAIVPNALVSPAQLKTAQTLFQAAGVWVEVEEKHMDAVTALSGSGPGYMAVILEALSDAGVAAGLPRETASTLALATMQGSARLISELKLHPGQFKDMVCSPGGTTIHGIMALEEGGLRAALMRAVQAAARRSRELA